MLVLKPQTIVSIILLLSFVIFSFFIIKTIRKMTKILKDNDTLLNKHNSDLEDLNKRIISLEKPKNKKKLFNDDIEVKKEKQPQSSSFASFFSNATPPGFINLSPFDLFGGNNNIPKNEKVQEIVEEEPEIICEDDVCYIKKPVKEDKEEEWNRDGSPVIVDYTSEICKKTSPKKESDFSDEDEEDTDLDEELKDVELN